MPDPNPNMLIESMLKSACVTSWRFSVMERILCVEAEIGRGMPNGFIYAWT